MGKTAGGEYFISVFLSLFYVCKNQLLWFNIETYLSGYIGVKFIKIDIMTKRGHFFLNFERFLH